MSLVGLKVQDYCTYVPKGLLQRRGVLTNDRLEVILVGEDKKVALGSLIREYGLWSRPTGKR